ncbi:dihydroorotase-like cyclic amidohydrolase [Pseudomonas sp. YL-218 TE3947]
MSWRCSKTSALAQKRITAEVCLHHLLFDDRDYPSLGNLIKCNPAIKTQADRDALRKALLSNRLDVIGSDHAPHTWAEKQRPYSQAPSGLPLVQHALPALLELVADEVLPITTLVAKTSHRVADLFAIPDRGYLREGYWADLVLIKPEPDGVAVSRQPILSQCGWTPFTHHCFRHSVTTTVVSGQIAWHDQRLNDSCQGLALRFMR